MRQPTSERAVELENSSWELIDQAQELDGELTPSEILNSFVQGYLAEDGGEGIRRAEARAKLEKLFGTNQG